MMRSIWYCQLMAMALLPLVLIMQLKAAFSPEHRAERLLRQRSLSRGRLQRAPSEVNENSNVNVESRAPVALEHAGGMDHTKVAKSARLEAKAEMCFGRAHLELWGDLVENGQDNLQPSADACCRSCQEFEPHPDIADGKQCNIWVWHPDRRECWLKHQQAAEFNISAKRAAERAPATGTTWTSGVWQGIKPCTACKTSSNFVGCIGKSRCNTSRACGSPAIDGYAHVDPKCFEASPTAMEYASLLAAGTRLEAFHELGADYDGLGVRWGIGHTKSTWEQCEEACRVHRPSPKGGPFSKLPCNTWTWCGAPRCFEPDAHSHSFGDCWLKFQELPAEPEVNQRSPGMLVRWRHRHHRELAKAPFFVTSDDNVTWVSGVLLPPGQKMGKGTWGPRAFW